MPSLTCEPKKLAETLAAVKPGVGRQQLVQALTGVHITANTAGNHLHTTNMDVHIRRGFAGERDGDLDVLVPHARLSDAIKLFAKHEQVTLEPTDEELVISAGARKITLRLLRLEDFHEFPGAQTSKIFETDGASFAQTIERTGKFISTDDYRPVLTGMLLSFARNGKLALVGCDSYRLGIITLGQCEIAEQSIITPQPAAQETVDVNLEGRGMLIAAKAMRKVEKVTVRAGTNAGQHNNWAIIQWPSATYAIRIIDGQYPNWRQLMPEDGSFEGRITIPIDELRGACEVAIKFLAKKAPARLYANGAVKLHGDTPDVGSFEEILPGATATVGEHEPFEIGLNPVFLLDIANTYRGDEVSVRLQSPLKPALFEDDGDQYLMMPTRLNV